MQNKLKKRRIQEDDTTHLCHVAEIFLDEVEREQALAEHDPVYVKKNAPKNEYNSSIWDY